MRVCGWLAPLGRVVEELAREPFPLRSVAAPSCPSPHSHRTAHKYPTSPTCHILPETQGLGFGYSESVCGGGCATLPDWGMPPGASSSLPLDTGCSTHQPSSP